MTNPLVEITDRRRSESEDVEIECNGTKYTASRTRSWYANDNPHSGVWGGWWLRRYYPGRPGHPGRWITRRHTRESFTFPDLESLTEWIAQSHAGEASA